MGYVGSVVAGHLRALYPQASLIGFDSGYFADCLTTAGENPPETVLDNQILGDVREPPEGLFDGADAVIHLAAISNDPMGSRFEAVTNDINFRATAAVADAASRGAVRNFVFASSCSVYGAADGAARRETDEVAPLTAYGRSKIAVERHLEQHSGDMAITCLRFATACGMSPRLRLDLVLNDFVACALASRKIAVLSDGTPWRPLIDVRDMARAIEWAAVRAPENGGRFLSVNVGSDSHNFQVKDLAEAVAEEIPGVEVDINAAAPPDRRSYRVDFSLFREIAREHTPRVTLAESIAGIRDGLRAMEFADANFRNSQHMRLKVLEAHLAAGRLTPDLRWRVHVH
jgi:nucleoside-diphosphate-sugar epimerase